MQTRRTDDAQLKFRWRLFTHFRDSAMKSARSPVSLGKKMYKAARSSPIPPRALRSARLLGHGHVQTCQTLRLSASRSRVLAGFAPLIQPHLHTLTSPACNFYKSLPKQPSPYKGKICILPPRSVQRYRPPPFPAPPPPPPLLQDENFKPSHPHPPSLPAVPRATQVQR